MKASPPRQKPEPSVLGPALEHLRRDIGQRGLESDPLSFPRSYARDSDREVVALIASALAFGRVASIRASVGKILEALGPSPALFLRDGEARSLPGLTGFVHRWIDAPTIALFLAALSRALRRHGSLTALLARHDQGGADMLPALEASFAELRTLAGTESRGLRFLLPSVAGGGACKRAHLFLRWMVRTQEPDLGLARGGRFSAARLLIPMDTHVHRISGYLGLTKRPVADLAAAREVTAWLRLLCPEDPVRYDWALCHHGILSACTRKRRPELCASCSLRPACGAAERGVSRDVALPVISPA